jgi:hypothetical protein
MRLIVDETPDPRTTKARVWRPVDQPHLSDEVAGLGDVDDTTIISWVRGHGFLGLRADPRERCEGIEEIREAAVGLGQTLALARAVRSVPWQALRTQVETIIGLPAGILAEINDEEPKQPLSGKSLAERVGFKARHDGRWKGAGAYIQALYWLGRLLDEPLRRYVRVRPALMPLPDGMRLQAKLEAVGPLGVAYLQVLDEASWPAITYEGSSVQLHALAGRHCGQCGTVFRPGRRNQRWCSERCRWRATKVRRRGCWRSCVPPKGRGAESADRRSNL